jgi:hypothetical protein
MLPKMAPKPRPFVPRAGAPIPQRFPALTWRKPAVLWAPAALILALGWPAWALMDEPGMLRFTVLAGAAALVVALISFGIFLALGKPPRTRRAVMHHVLLGGLVAALLSPFFLQSGLEALATQSGQTAAPLPHGAALALAPLCLVLGLPMAYVAGFAFSHVALIKPAKAAHEADPDPPRPDPVQRYNPAYDDAFG